MRLISTQNYLSTHYIPTLNTTHQPQDFYLNRAPRSTRTELINAEAHQSLVIAALLASGHADIANRLARCQHDRQRRTHGWPWRCRSPGCWACRRTTVRNWWRGFKVWFDGCNVCLAVIPITGNPITVTRKLRKGLRDVRDRSARTSMSEQDGGWAKVEMAGLVDGDRMLVLIKHNGIVRADVWSVLERRWPDVLVTDPVTIEPSSHINIEDATDLARHRRGIQPIRFIIQQQMAASDDQSDEPMPMII